MRPMFAFQEANLATVRSDRVNMILPKARNQMPTLKPKEKQLVEYLSKNMYIYIYGCFRKKQVVLPNHQFSLINHPFWGFSPIFGLQNLMFFDFFWADYLIKLPLKRRPTGGECLLDNNLPRYLTCGWTPPFPGFQDSSHHREFCTFVEV